MFIMTCKLYAGDLKYSPAEKSVGNGNIYRILPDKGAWRASKVRSDFGRL